MRVYETWLRQWPKYIILSTVASRCKQFTNNSDESDSSKQYLIECVVFMSNRVHDLLTYAKPQKLKCASKRKYIYTTRTYTYILYNILYYICGLCITRNTRIRRTESNSIVRVYIRILPTSYHVNHVQVNVRNAWLIF